MTNPIDYGAPPLNDEPEIVVFGPGRGEAIAVHIGDHGWLLVDSCIDPSSNTPAALAYLEALGLKTDVVRAIVVTHWHDDHVRGIAAVVRACRNAEVFVSSVLRDVEMAALVAAHSGQPAVAASRGTRELYDVLRQSRYCFASLRTIVLEEVRANQSVKVVAISPNQAAQVEQVLRLGSYIPTNAAAPINHAPEIRPNLAAIALHVQIGDLCFLLGADVEEHAAFGWSAILNDRWVAGLRPACAVKVPHHGGESAHCLAMWEKLVEAGPTSVMTPYSPSRLPREADIARLKELSGALYIASAASRRPQMPRDIERRLRGLASDIAPVEVTFGAVRLRYSDGAWRGEVFGAAAQLAEAGASRAAH